MYMKELITTLPPSEGREIIYLPVSFWGGKYGKGEEKNGDMWKKKERKQKKGEIEVKKQTNSRRAR
jgi:hypothetical protein